MGKYKIPIPQLMDDYEEACAIVNLSPKASATLSRRCLQGMIAQIILLDDKESAFPNPFEYISTHENNIIIKPTLTTESVQKFQNIY